MQYRRLDPSKGLADHLYELKAQIRANDTAPTGDVGLSGHIVATDPQTGIETILGRLPDGSTGIQQWVNDITPPGQPSVPLAEPTIGGVIITWDGKISGGTSQPRDYDRTEVEYSSNGTIWSLGGTLYAANSYTVPALTIGTQYSFRLISYDKNNNASTPSAIVTATPVAMVDNPDLENALQDLRDADAQININVEEASQAAGERSRIVHLDTTPPTPATGWKDGDVWYKHTTTDIKSPIVDWYIWKTNTWELQVLDETFLPLVNIGAGTYGTLRGNSFAAKSISAEALIVGDFSNLWQNPDFETDTVGQQAKGLTPNVNVLVIAGGANGSGKALSIGARSGGNQDIYDTNLISVQPGDEFHLSAYGKFANTVGTGVAGVGFRLYNASREPVSWQRVVNFTTKTTTWPIIPTTGSFIVPAGIYFLQPWATFADNAETTNSFHVDDIEIRRKNKGVLIVDGAFDARTITGALIQSRSEANKGIKLTSAHLVAYNDLGTETLRFDGTNSIITGAVIRTAATGARLQIDTESLRAWDDQGVEYFTMTSGEVNLTGVTNTRGLTHHLYGSKPITTSVGTVGIYNAASNTYSNIPGIEWQLDEDPDTMMSYPSIISYSGKDISLTGGVTPEGRYAEIDLWSDVGDIGIKASRNITLQTSSSTSIVNIFSPGGIFLNDIDHSPKYLRFSQSASAPSATLRGPGSPAFDDYFGTSVTNGFAVWIENDYLEIKENGFYTLSFNMALSLPVTGRSFCSMEVVTETWATARSNIAVGEDTTSCAFTRYLAAGDRVRFAYYHTSSGDRTVRSRGTILKHAGI